VRGRRRWRQAPREERFKSRDGALWFTEVVSSANKIGRVTTAGSFSEFPIPTAASRPQQITAGPDGAVWFTEQFGNMIGRIVPDCSTSNRGVIIAQNGDRARLTGRAVTSAAGQPTGSQTYSDSGPADQVLMRSTSIAALFCDGRDASIFGQALVNDNEQSFQIDLHNGGGPRKDTYRIRLANGYDSGAQALRSGGVRVR
jgi:hypothetical protein